MSKTNIVLLGPPGAGKGTLASMIAEELKIPHISTGDIFRSEINQGTELGKKAKEYVNSGRLVPDELVADMVGSRLSKKDCKTGYILDGFPRTLRQAELFEETLRKMDKKLDVVVYFEASKELLLKRLTARLLCKKCGAIFNKIFSPPKKENECDHCGGELYQRADDSLETAEKRLRVYDKQTAPLLEYYREKGLLKKINSEGEKAESYQALKKVLEF